MNAREAKEIIDSHEIEYAKGNTIPLYNYARGYLEALEGLEVNALVDSIQKFSDKGFTNVSGDEMRAIKKALAQYRDVVKK